MPANHTSRSVGAGGHRVSPTPPVTGKDLLSQVRASCHRRGPPVTGEGLLTQVRASSPVCACRLGRSAPPHPLQGDTGQQGYGVPGPANSCHVGKSRGQLPATTEAKGRRLPAGHTPRRFFRILLLAPPTSLLGGGHPDSTFLPTQRGGDCRPSFLTPRPAGSVTVRAD